MVEKTLSCNTNQPEQRIQDGKRQGVEKKVESLGECRLHEGKKKKKFVHSHSLVPRTVTYHEHSIII